MQPAIIINTAAYTAVDQAESDAETAFRVNRDGAREHRPGGEASRRGAAAREHRLHLRRNEAGPYLEDDPPHPQSVYGASKLAGEKAVRETLEAHWIVRSAWMHGIHGKSFPDTILRAAAAGKSLRVVNDQRGCPTYTVHLAEALAAIIAQPHYGTYHAVNSGACTWYELACFVTREAGLEVEITPCSTDEFPRPAPRPGNSVLDTSKLAAVYGVRLPAWEEGVAEFVRRRGEEAKRRGVETS